MDHYQKLNMNQQLQYDNFLFIKNFLSKKQTKILSKQFYLKIVQGLGGVDSQCSNAISIHSLEIFEKILKCKKHQIQKFVGIDLKETYSYARLYKKNSFLKPHYDKDDCAFSATVNLKQDKPYPFWIKNSEHQTKQILMEEGDAVIYLGNKALHWRNVFDGEVYCQLFLHYIEDKK